MGQLHKNRAGRMVNPLSPKFNMQGRESSDSTGFGGILAQKPTAMCTQAYVASARIGGFSNCRLSLIRA
jgi:hypothetical protein